ncbi:sensory neuron membrane protein 1-like isoform X2 [Phymastichus coffea]|nr:sensory neuron membrane protein 1-like isoform X2 [Phymastichus coffea]
MRNTYYFNAEKSNGLTGNEEIVIANLFALGLVNTLMREKPSAIPIFGKAIDSLFKKPDNLFIKTTPRAILFDGLHIDCTAKDFAGAAICDQVREKYEEFGMIKVAENEYLFSLWGSRNGTDSKKPTRVLRGLKNIMDVGKVIEYNYKNNLSVWDDEYCDRLNGSDGTIFHPNFDKHGKDPMIAFNDGLCRTIACIYDQKSKFRGIKTLRYTTDLGTDPDNPLHKCYCKAPDDCLKKGVYDAYKCVGAPIVVSNPHFYLADPEYLTMVDGLKPDKELHAVAIDLDAFTGSPVQAHIRAQFNFFLFKVEKYKIMKNFPSALLPIFWIDEHTILPDFLIKEIKDGHRLLMIGSMFKIMVLLGGLGTIAYGGFSIYKDMNGNEVQIKKTVKPKSGDQANGDDKKMPMNISRTVPQSMPPNID